MGFELGRAVLVDGDPAIAVRQLADLTPDPRVAARLLVALQRGARRAWERERGSGR